MNKNQSPPGGGDFYLAATGDNINLAVVTHLSPFPTLTIASPDALPQSRNGYSAGLLTLNNRLVTLRTGTPSHFGCRHARLRDALDEPTKGHP
jgi:hypothetical protein